MNAEVVPHFNFNFFSGDWISIYAGLKIYIYVCRVDSTLN